MTQSVGAAFRRRPAEREGSIISEVIWCFGHLVIWVSGPGPGAAPIAAA